MRDKTAAAIMTLTSLLWVVFMTTVLSVTAENISVRPGEDVTLPCRAPGVINFTVIEWTRSDLGSDDYVFYFRDNHPYESYQHESYRGRVQLKDPELKAGDASLILRNVSVKDSGTYECEVNGDDERSVYLQVTQPEVISVTSGEDVTLPCRAPAVSNFTKIVWTRSDLGSDDYVFFFKDNHPNESIQLKSYRGRVHLKDPDLKAGDASVILRNVNVDDSGTYECEVNGDAGRRRKRATPLQRFVDLKVSPPGVEVVDQTGGGVDRGHPGLIAGVSVGLLVSVVGVVGVVGVLLWRKRNQRAAQPAAPEEVPLPTIRQEQEDQQEFEVVTQTDEEHCDICHNILPQHLFISNGHRNGLNGLNGLNVTQDVSYEHSIVNGCDRTLATTNKLST